MSRSRQIYYPITDRRKRALGFAVLTFVLAGCLAVVLKTVLIEYKPPALEKESHKGSPQVEEKYLYREIETDFGYSFGIAANLFRLEDGSIDICFTNPASNTVSIRCEVTDAETGKLYFQSGRLEPGTYVMNLPALTEPDGVKHEVYAKIYAFLPKDYTSAGTTTLHLTLQPW